MLLTMLLGVLVLLRRSLWTSTRLSAVAARTASLGVSRFGGKATIVPASDCVSTFRGERVEPNFRIRQDHSTSRRSSRRVSGGRPMRAHAPGLGRAQVLFLTLVLAAEALSV